MKLAWTWVFPNQVYVSVALAQEAQFNQENAIDMKGLLRKAIWYICHTQGNTEKKLKLFSKKHLLKNSQTWIKPIF